MASKTVTSGINKVGNNYYKTEVTDNGNGTFSSTLFRTDANGNSETPIAGSAAVSGGGTTSNAYEINTTNATPEEQKLLSDPNSQLRQAQKQQIQSTEKTFFPDGATKEQKEAIADSTNSGSAKNSGTNQSGDQNSATPEQQQEFESENPTFKEGTRTEYKDLKYPLDLALEHQDCIKFTILEYKPSLASSGANTGKSSGISRAVTVESGKPGIKGVKALGTITLPIPAGINDTNSVDWQQDTINQLQDMGASIAKGLIEGGAAGAEKPLNDAANKIGEETKKGDLQKGLGAMFAGLAVGSQRIQQRAYGSIFNNNLELLFNGPTLRSAFTFSFKLSPRSENEAKEIRKIIRSFKQAMSVKRSATSLLLKTPHTFAIAYLTSNQEHPYLNKFKECALQSFTVDYTPEGQYMTYMSENPDGRSMISYNISLTFQELEPVFDDEYGNEPIDSIKYIGF